MNQWALVTGASSGIGKAFARLLASEGWNLYIVARTKETLESLATELSAVEVIPIPLDLSKANAAQEVYKVAKKRGEMPHLVLNNAGVGYLGPVLKEAPTEALAMMHLNMDALVKLSMLFLPHLLERHKTQKHCGIVNIASISMAFPVPYMAIYAASKAFVNSFTLALAQEHPSLRITAVCPGPVATNFGPVASKNFMPHSRHRDAPEDIAEHAYAMWLEKRHLALFSRRVSFLNILSHLLPRRLAAWISGIVITQNRNPTP